MNALRSFLEWSPPEVQLEPIGNLTRMWNQKDLLIHGSNN